MVLKTCLLAFQEVSHKTAIMTKNEFLKMRHLKTQFQNLMIRLEIPFEMLFDCKGLCVVFNGFVKGVPMLEKIDKGGCF